MSSARTYQCTSPMVQLTAPRSSGIGNVTVFRHGDILPAWIDPEEARRLLTDGLIAEVGA